MVNYEMLPFPSAFEGVTRANVQPFHGHHPPTSDALLAIGIKSVVGNVEKRKAMREWLKPIAAKDVVYKFVLGLGPNMSVPAVLNNEQAEHGDIEMMNFVVL